MNATRSKPSPEEVATAWEAAWPRALDVWSRFTRLRTPTFCLRHRDAKEHGLTGSFAMIRLSDQTIVVDIAEVLASGVENFAVEVLAHEIGHHVFAPATLTDHARSIARMRWALPTLEERAPMVANLYTDLLINDRLQRSAELRLADVYRAMSAGNTESGAVWAVYMRIYEILWRLERGALNGGAVDDRMEGDAWLGARLVRSFAREWLDGAGRFAALMLPYLLEDKASANRLQKLFDTRDAGANGEPGGLTQMDADETGGAIHPASDPALTGHDEQPQAREGNDQAPADVLNNRQATGQAREPFEYGEILKAIGLNLSDHEMAVRYYRERAQPHLIPFPSRKSPEQADPLPEGLEPWDFGHPLDTADWLQSVMQSPRIVPGMTTVQRVWGNSPGNTTKTKPLDLDLYVDSSGSMPNPQVQTSYLALAGAIMALSALRAGARVQVTLWSGTRQFTCTDGFTRDQHAILATLTGFFGGATAFPIHVLRDTYLRRRHDAAPAHVMVISDDGVTTMFDSDERNQDGWAVSQAALARAGGGGSFVLNIPEDWERYSTDETYAAIKRARDDGGWKVHAVSSWEDLVAFARRFSRETYHVAGDKPSSTHAH